jgi:Spy/CpxP family protein refolding chaperone
VQFVLGVAIGLGIGFAGAILFAPDKTKRTEWPPRFPGVTGEEKEGNHQDTSGLQAFFDAARERVREASEEARKAKDRSEREMLQKYERLIGRKAKV